MRALNAFIVLLCTYKTAVVTGGIPSAAGITYLEESIASVASPYVFFSSACRLFATSFSTARMRMSRQLQHIPPELRTSIKDS